MKILKKLFNRKKDKKYYCEYCGREYNFTSECCKRNYYEKKKAIERKAREEKMKDFWPQKVFIANDKNGYWVYFYESLSQAEVDARLNIIDEVDKYFIEHQSDPIMLAIYFKDRLKEQGFNVCEPKKENVRMFAQKNVLVICKTCGGCQCDPVTPDCNARCDCEVDEKAKQDKEKESCGCKISYVKVNDKIVWSCKCEEKKPPQIVCNTCGAKRLCCHVLCGMHKIQLNKDNNFKCSECAKENICKDCGFVKEIPVHFCTKSDKRINGITGLVEHRFNCWKHPSIQFLAYETCTQCKFEKDNIERLTKEKNILFLLKASAQNEIKPDILSCTFYDMKFVTEFLSRLYREKQAELDLAQM